MLARSLSITGFIVVVCFQAGCGRDRVVGPETGADFPIQLILYSIDGRKEAEKSLEGKETFYGYLVLGKVDVKDAEKRKELFAALKQGMAHKRRVNGTLLLAAPRHSPGGKRKDDGLRDLFRMPSAPCPLGWQREDRTYH